MKTEAEENDFGFLFTFSAFNDNPQFWTDAGFNELTPTPQLLITEIREGLYFVYKTIFRGEFKRSELLDFIEDYKNGKTTPYLKSESHTI